jgi:hypothetical protein
MPLLLLSLLISLALEARRELALYSRKRVGSCPTPLGGGGLLGHVTIAPYSCERASASLKCSIYYKFLRELRRTP